MLSVWMAEVDQHYSNYRADPNPENLNRVLQALEPTIHHSLASVNALGDPVARSKAYLFAADAVHKYNPALKEGSALPTFVSSQLQQMTRAMRTLRSPSQIPERVQLDSYKLDQAKKSYADEFGREPDTGELADYTGLPVKRIEKIHRYQFSTPSESALSDITREEPDFDREAVDYVYHAADHTDRRILEHRTGYGGHPVLEPRDLAVKLKLSPVQLTRRSMRLTHRVNEAREALHKVAV